MRHLIGFDRIELGYNLELCLRKSCRKMILPSAQNVSATRSIFCTYVNPTISLSSGPSYQTFVLWVKAYEDLRMARKSPELPK